MSMNNEKIDEIAYALDKIFAPLEELVNNMAQAVTDEILPAYIAEESLKKFRQGRLALYELVPNGDRFQLDCALEELRAERSKSK